MSSIFGEGPDEEEEEEEEGMPQNEALRQLEATKTQPEERPTKRKKHQHSENSKTTEKLLSVRKEYWLRRDILVKIRSKTLSDGRYFGRKAAVDRLVDKYTAEVEVLDSGPDTRDGGDILRLDQDDLETVVPKAAGKPVRILNGRGRGKRAVVVSLDPKERRATLEVATDQEQSPLILKHVDYADFSKEAI
eukprot:CAMPEP_0116844090 /NCGR_PEP_ID=MMETSP0418-20121206/12469_1 /TAXON_ID=1158023 /ORGANISM="Astrosyne radiata, Strain 13vi08-1A" /LENGTH=190 /DNA_ID=CAMNT_0004474953 /DNA_START=75 /DNA_END=647 /DNA_ORIENTATION=+